MRNVRVLPKMGNPFGKMLTKIKKTEKTQAQTETQTASAQTEQTASTSIGKVYLKALPLRDLEDVEAIKREVNEGNVVILKVSPLARKSVDDVKRAVSELLEFAQSVGGDIARLGEERVVITPSSIRIWREKTATPKGTVPTAA